MTYFKVLKWGGGEGGDALLACALLSNPHIKSNVKIETLNLTLQGRTVIQVDEEFRFPSLKRIAIIPDVIFEDIINELEQLKSLNENYLLKSHATFPKMPYSVGIFATPKTLPFMFKAKFSKLARYYVLNELDLYNEYRKNNQKIIDRCIDEYQDVLFKSSMIKQDLFIEDLILKNYDKMQNVLELNFNSAGIEYFEAWVEKQKELYWNELKILFK